MLRKISILGLLPLALACVYALAQGMSGIPFPNDYRTWYRHHTTVNLAGHVPVDEIGIQDVYANAAAVKGLESGTFADGAAFVVDRVTSVEGPNNTLASGPRKVIAVMLRDAQMYKDTGGWGFEAFKAGDPKQRVVQDGGKACFVCHAPHAANNFLFTKGLN
jgi:hypothetical protein